MATGDVISSVVTGTLIKDSNGRWRVENQPHVLIDLGNLVSVEYLIPDDASFHEEEAAFGRNMYRLFGKNWRDKGWRRRFKASEYKSMAHIMHAAGMFGSVGEARRNGWDKPVTQGTYFVGKGMNRKMIVVADG